MPRIPDFSATGGTIVARPLAPFHGSRGLGGSLLPPPPTAFDPSLTARSARDGFLNTLLRFPVLVTEALYAGSTDVMPPLNLLVASSGLIWPALPRFPVVGSPENISHRVCRLPVILGNSLSVKSVLLRVGAVDEGVALRGMGMWVGTGGFPDSRDKGCCASMGETRPLEGAAWDRLGTLRSGELGGDTSGCWIAVPVGAALSREL